MPALENGEPGHAARHLADGADCVNHRAGELVFGTLLAGW